MGNENAKSSSSGMLVDVTYNGEIEENEEEKLQLNKKEEHLNACVCGTVERVNKLISVIPFSPTTYSGQVGDLVIGRIVSVGSTRWRVSLGPGCREAVLPLSGVNLPSGIQRMRTSEDALGMRQLYREGDLLSAEVQQVSHSDGVLHLHARSLKYGKLENGCLIEIYPTLIPRRKQHFCTLNDVNIDILLGTNGWIWIQRSIPQQWKVTLEGDDESRPLAQTLQLLQRRHASTSLLPDERENVARVRNIIEALKLLYIEISPDIILQSIRLLKDVKVVDILSNDVMLNLSNDLRRTKQV